MVRVPGDKPHVPQITPKEIKAEPKGEKAEQAARGGQKIPNIGKGPEYDTAALTSRAKATAGMLAALAVEAEKKELSFIDILERVMKLTGMNNPEAAMEEANRKLQKEIDEELDSIKANKDLMEEAESWQTFADLLESQLSENQVESFISLLKAEVKGKHVL
ncbi:MAG: hypothetical protein KKB81_05920 [Candidatus Margulisbacteria bacterium]|nr:hypothetical protein [Candidatus Margulisiibacteriota bacterium]MBU1021818.1 hypothetical protein [Candidatus Margulisiibacteriota bacterium]MBU1728977.1 hypothetical protein [Candidatus Margulisiibacteriota bacterium]MBU1954470.1 hypothetical protein [Candidatus Margulisiibacteriota bacterium]